MFIRAHEAEYMFVTTLSEKGLLTLAVVRCPYKLFRLKYSAVQLKFYTSQKIRNYLPELNLQFK